MNRNSELSVSEHVGDVISSCAIRVRRSHGMCNCVLQIVYRVVIISKLTKASSAWWAFPQPPTGVVENSSHRKIIPKRSSTG